MFWKLEKQEFAVPPTCSPSTLFHYSNSGSFLDIDRFPLSQVLIEEMPNYLDRINWILWAASVLPISLQDIVNLQRIASIIDKDILMDELIELETQSMPIALWLYSYLEIHIPVEDFDPRWTNAFHDTAMQVLGN